MYFWLGIFLFIIGYVIYSIFTQVRGQQRYPVGYQQNVQPRVGGSPALPGSSPNLRHRNVPSKPLPQIDLDHIPQKVFAKDANERQAILEAKKQLMLQQARKQYLDKKIGVVQPEQVVNSDLQEKEKQVEPSKVEAKEPSSTKVEKEQPKEPSEAKSVATPTQGHEVKEGIEEEAKTQPQQLEEEERVVEDEPIEVKRRLALEAATRRLKLSQEVATATTTTTPPVAATATLPKTD